jgi:hypothetical protein
MKIKLLLIAGFALVGMIAAAGSAAVSGTEEDSSAVASPQSHPHPNKHPRCGDALCNGTESCGSCPGDCGVCCPDTDLDGICEAGDGCNSSGCGSSGRTGDGSSSYPYSDCTGVTWCAYCTTSRGIVAFCGPNGLGGTNCGLAC